MTSENIPADGFVGRSATYDIKPRLNRLNGVASVIIQGEKQPEFEITPDPSKYAARPRLRAGYSGHSDAHEHHRFPRAC